jgi:hypothetical protein
VIASRSTFGSWVLRSRLIGLLIGLFDSVRVFSATPPTTPARAAPPAISGVFAFDATVEIFFPVLRTEADCGVVFDTSAATFSPVLPTGPFAAVLRALALDVVARREAVVPRPFELVRLVLDEAFALLEPFLLVELFVLRDVERLLEERVVWGIVLASFFLASLPGECTGGADSSLPAPATI